MSVNLGKPLRLRNDSGAQLELERGGIVRTLTVNASGVLVMDGTQNLAIVGGSINGTPIGGTTASTGAFTTVSASTSVTTPLVTNAGTLALSATGANVITASTNGEERMRIDSAGRVGLNGTPTGTGVDTGNTRLYVVSPNDNLGPAATFITDSVGRGVVIANQDKNIIGAFSIASGAFAVGTNTNTPLMFLTSATERMRIDGAGNVLPGSNNAYDLGATGTRFRDGWFARNLLIAGDVGVGTSTPNTLFSSNRELQVDSSTGKATLAVSVLEGVDNHRIALFVDDDTGTMGIETSTSSGAHSGFSIVHEGSLRWRVARGGTVFIGNDTAVPSVDPVGGGFLYVEAGALKYRGSSGTVTTIANA
jgi:hypothetical protein